MIRSLTLIAACTAATLALAQQPRQAAPLPSPQPPGAQQQQQPSGPPPRPTPQQTAADIKMIHACIDLKSPEGELPPEGNPAREKILKESEGGPQACVGTIIEACQKAGGKEDACSLREATAWLASTNLDKATETKFGPKNVGVYKAASSKILANAIALCKAAASVSAWGADAIKTNAPEGQMDIEHPCVFDAVVQQSLIILVNKRGN